MFYFPCAIESIEKYNFAPPNYINMKLNKKKILKLKGAKYGCH